MAYRLIARMLLVCYGVIALWGQGLHSLVDEDGCEAGEHGVAVVEAVSHSVCVSDAANSQELNSVSGVGHLHDCDHCPICQFQSLGQHYVVPTSAEIGLTACDNFLPGHVQLVQCPAPFSPAQPRAPPVA
jgi:hypothetical protein